VSNLDDIIEAIRALQKTGDKLPSERDLAERLNVKRHQLRKALALLRESGDIAPAAARRSRSKLTQYSDELVGLTNPIEVLELRLLVEPGHARLASLRASLPDINRITEAATTPDTAVPSEVDLAFHTAVAEATRNNLASTFYRMLRRVGVDARLKVASSATKASCPKRISMRDAEHKRVADAIARRDPDAAEAAMRAHLQSVQRLIYANEPPSGVAGSDAA